MERHADAVLPARLPPAAPPPAVSASPLAVRDVVKSFGQGEAPVRALDGVSLRVDSGEFVAVMGRSGSGKSTLLHLAAGLTPPDAGSVRVDGQELSDLGDRRLTLFRRRRIGLVFQAFNLVPTLTALENVALPLVLDGRPRREAGEHGRGLLESLGLGPRASHRPDALSGGEQQRVAIARALVADPALLLADEPTGNLDSENGTRVCRLLADLAGRGRTIVMVTHEPAVAVYASRVVVLRDGRLADDFATAGMAAADLAARYQS